MVMAERCGLGRSPPPLNPMQGILNFADEVGLWCSAVLLAAPLSRSVVWICVGCTPTISARQKPAVSFVFQPRAWNFESIPHWLRSFKAKNLGPHFTLVLAESSGFVCLRNFNGHIAFRQLPFLGVVAHLYYRASHRAHCPERTSSMTLQHRPCECENQPNQ